MSVSDTPSTVPSQIPPAHTSEWHWDPVKHVCPLASRRMQRRDKPSQTAPPSQIEAQ